MHDIFSLEGLVFSIMACLNNLKQDIKTLESLFPKGHEVFQVTAASLDELTCRFINRNGKKFEIHANITVSNLDGKMKIE